MAQRMEKPRVTEIQVRMDCNGCVQKIKKALHGIHGISDLYIDFPQQKITIVGSADPEKIVKALKKTRKSAIVCSHIEQEDPPTNKADEAATGDSEEAPPDSSCNNKNPQPEAPPAEAAKPAEPTQEFQPPDKEKQTHQDVDTTKNEPDQPSKPRDVEEVHVIYHYPPDYGYRYGDFAKGIHEPPPRDHGYRYNNYGQSMIHEPPRDPGYTRSYNYGQSMSHEPPKDYGNISRYTYGQSMSTEPTRYNYGQSMSHEPPRDHGYGQSVIRESLPRDSGYRTHHARPIGPEFRPEVPHPGQPPVHVSHSYNNYQPSPYVTGYEYIRSPPRYTQYTTRPEHYSEDYHYGNNGSNGTISSVFSDENPNACTIA